MSKYQETIATTATSYSSGDVNLISRNAFNFIMGFVLCWGVGLAYFLALKIDPSIVRENRLMFIIAYFVSAISGIALSKVSDKPIISFIGFNLVVAPMGVLLTTIFDTVPMDLIHGVMAQTLFLTGVMMLMGTVFPDFFKGIGRALMMALVALIVSQLICVLFGLGSFAIINFIAVGIFAGFIGHDWAMAQSDEPTVDNAIDASVGMFINMFNLFIHLLSLQDD